MLYCLDVYCKVTFYMREKFMQICKNGPLDILFMCSSALCIATYGAIKIYAVQIYVTCA